MISISDFELLFELEHNGLAIRQDAKSKFCEIPQDLIDLAEYLFAKPVVKTENKILGQIEAKAPEILQSPATVQEIVNIAAKDKMAAGQNWFFTGAEKEADIFIVFPFLRKSPSKILNKMLAEAQLDAKKLSFCYLSPLDTSYTEMHAPYQARYIHFAKKLIDLTQPKTILTFSNRACLLLTGENISNEINKNEINKKYNEIIPIYSSFFLPELADDTNKFHIPPAQLRDLWQKLLHIKHYLRQLDL